MTAGVAARPPTVAAHRVRIVSPRGRGGARGAIHGHLTVAGRGVEAMPFATTTSVAAPAGAPSGTWKRA
jgi:hypothetical protein